MVEQLTLSFMCLFLKVDLFVKGKVSRNLFLLERVKCGSMRWTIALNTVKISSCSNPDQVPGPCISRGGSLGSRFTPLSRSAL